MPTQTKGYGTRDKIRFEAEQIIQRKSQPGQRERERGREREGRRANWTLRRADEGGEGEEGGHYRKMKRWREQRGGH